MVRNNSYDTITSDISNLVNMSTLGRNILKSQETNLAKFEGHVMALSKSDEISKVVYKKFADLRADFEIGAINPARYKNGLEPLKDFIDKGAGADSKFLNKAEIVEELSKFF